MHEAFCLLCWKRSCCWKQRQVFCLCILRQPGQELFFHRAQMDWTATQATTIVARLHVQSSQHFPPTKGLVLRHATPENFSGCHNCYVESTRELWKQTSFQQQLQTTFISQANRFTHREAKVKHSWGVNKRNWNTHRQFYNRKLLFSDDPFCQGVSNKVTKNHD